jgi:UDP-N-acetylmuramoyl-tripeptide--D-alanyl-D-alanine ligase
MEAALTNFAKFDGGNKLAILGDMLELGEVSAEEHAKIVDLARSLGITNLLLVGSEFMSVAHDDDAILFANADELTAYIESNPIENSLVLVKGSHGIKLQNSLSLL